MIDAVDLFRIGVAAREGWVEYAHGEQEIGVLEPFQVIRHRGLRSLVAQRLEIAREIVDGVKRCGVVHQPVRQIGHRLWV